MRDEIIKLLKIEGKISDETIDELQKVNIHDFAKIVKEIGLEKTDYIDAEKILEDLDTKYIGKKLYVFNEVSSTNTVAKFLAMNETENGTVIISEKQTDARGRSGKAWESPLGGVWLSLILQPNVDYSKNSHAPPGDMTVTSFISFCPNRICGLPAPANYRW